jgi:hypothetical protein
MGNESGGTTPGAEPRSTVGRRDFLRKAAVAGTGAFAVPMIVTVDPADAQALTSPPPEPPVSSTKPKNPGTGVAGAPRPQRGSRRQMPARTGLPRTGADIDRLVAAGLAATAGGAALVLWSADAQAKSKTKPVSDGPGDEEPTA